MTIGEVNEVLSAVAINDHDEVTGTFYSSGAPRAYLWSASRSLRDLGLAPNGASSYGGAINNRHMVSGTGAVFGSQTDQVALRWTRRSGFAVVGPPTGLNYGGGINDAGEMVGTHFTRNSYYGFDVDRAGALTVLHGLSEGVGEANAINRRGMIAGASAAPGATVLHAVVWENAQSVPLDIGTFPGGTTSYANALNNRGQVVGYSDGTLSQ